MSHRYLQLQGTQRSGSASTRSEKAATEELYEVMPTYTIEDATESQLPPPLPQLIEQQTGIDPTQTATAMEVYKSDEPVDGDENADDTDAYSEGTTLQSGVTAVTTIDRGHWAGQFDFLMSMIAYAVGLGNVWRFPYLCYKNGGGTFLLVYAIFFFLAAVPIFIMEVTVGQYLQRGAMEVWKMCPIFKGVGIGNVIISCMCISYFCVVVAWALHYMIDSFMTFFKQHHHFPWERCDFNFSSPNCTTGRETEAELIEAYGPNYKEYIRSSVDEYWHRGVLDESETITEIGHIQWHLITLMFIAWVIVYFALWKGITKARAFVYFCALFPYILIAILLVRGVTLEGASTGIKFYLTPNMTKLLEASVWTDAGTQVFYSYGVGFGTLIALGSHNEFNHNCYRDAILTCIVNGMTSILAGFAIFSTLGFMSHKSNKNIDDVVATGVGLAFKTYPEVASQLPMKEFWAILFFLMITILGLDSQVCMLEGVITAMEDIFPTLLRKHKQVSLLCVCIFFFMLGIPMVTQSGVYWLTLVDAYGASGIALLFVVFFEVVGLAWGFGADRVRGAMKEMIGIRTPFLVVLPFFWKFTAPLVTIGLFIFSIVMYKPLEMSEDPKKYYPTWAQVFGFGLSASSMVAIPAYALYYLFRQGRDNLTPIQRFLKGIHPPRHLRIGSSKYNPKKNRSKKLGITPEAEMESPQESVVVADPQQNDESGGERVFV